MSCCHHNKAPGKYHSDVHVAQACSTWCWYQGGRQRIIKINQSYDPHMSALQLYDATRGCWRRKIESVENARYAFATYKGDVVEVYKIDYWCHASELNRETLPYNPERHKNRIGFSGSVAPKEIRDKYIGKSVKNFFKWGEADPVKLIRAVSVAAQERNSN